MNIWGTSVQNLNYFENIEIKKRVEGQGDSNTYQEHKVADRYPPGQVMKIRMEYFLGYDLQPAVVSKQVSANECRCPIQWCIYEQFRK